MNMDECPVCGYGLDDCYDDDPGWMLCRDCEWCGYHDDLKRANEAKSTPPDMSDNPNTYALRLAHAIAADAEWADRAWGHMQHWALPWRDVDWPLVVIDVCRALREVRGIKDTPGA